MVTITRASVKDAALIADLGRRTFSESYDHIIPKPEMDSYLAEKFAIRHIEAELSDPEIIFSIIRYHDEPAGYSKIVLDCANPNIEAEHPTKLERLYLLKEFHSLRIGRQLFEKSAEISKRSGQDGMWLTVYVDNHQAIGFYEKMGFEMAGSYAFKVTETRSDPNHVMWLKH